MKFNIGDKVKVKPKGVLDPEGNYDFAWQVMVIHNFLTGTGQLDFAKFKNKIKQVSIQAVKSSRIKELCSNGGDMAVIEIYKILIDLMNFKNNTNFLKEK